MPWVKQCLLAMPLMCSLSRYCCVHFSTLRVLPFRPQTCIQDVEFELRGHCKRVKVVSQLFGDAHLVFPSESSLAVRLYDHHDLDGIKQRIQESAQSSSVRASAETSSTSRSTQGTTDLDVLSNFFQSFQYSAALFVIPDRRHQADQLSDFSSIYQRAQHMATEPVWTQSPRGQLVAKVRRDRTLRGMPWLPKH